MIVNAIYFPDKNATHIKLNNTASCRGSVHHFLINGQVVCSDTYKSDDFILPGKLESIKAVVSNKRISHYEHRETSAKVSTFEYDEYLKGLKTPDGEYKDLESEYLYRKYTATYIPVYREVFEEKDCAAIFQEEHPYEVDAYCTCSGSLEKSGLSNNYQPKFFLYKFDKWKFSNDIVVKIMEEFGVPCISPTPNPKTGVEYYRLYGRTDYEWLELCGDECFIKHDAMNFTTDYIYGTYEDIIKAEKLTENYLRNTISTKLGRFRTITIRKSVINQISEELKELREMLEHQDKRDKLKRKLSSICMKVDDIKR